MSIDLKSPTRQSVKGLLLIFIMSVRQAVKMLWAILIVFFLKIDVADHKRNLIIGLSFLLVILIVHTILYYLNFQFYIAKNEFILKKGYLKKKVLNIPLERIQNVNTKQNVLQQLLNVVGLEIDTAGSVGKELKIHALDGQIAKDLYQFLSTERETHNIEESETINPTPREKEKLVLKLDPSDLLKIGISQNHLKTGVIVLAFGGQLFNQINDIFKDETLEYTGRIVDFFSSSSVMIVSFFLLFFLIFSVLFSLVQTVIKYYDLKFSKLKNAYRIQAGLLNKRNVVFQMSKIQQLNWETGPLKKLFGIFTITLKQAKSGNRKEAKLVDAPGCLEKHVELLKNDLFGAEVLEETSKLASDPFYFRPLWFFTGWLPVILASPFLYFNFQYWPLALVWLIASAFYNLARVRKSYFKINKEQIRISGGAINHNWKQMELFKVQAVEFTQSIFQRRRSLGNLKLMNASGVIEIPYIDAQTAIAMRDYILYHSETSNKDWM